MNIIEALIRHPIRAAIVVGLLVVVLFGIASFPFENSIDRTVEGWLPEGAANDQAAVDDLIQSLETARESGDVPVTVSEDEFRGLDLEAAHATVDANDDGDFTVSYAGRDASDTLYVAESEIAPAPWWDPDRLFYRAAEAQADRLNNVAVLTFERDVDGLLGLLAVDLLIGTVYGTLVGLILWALRGGPGGFHVPEAGEIPAGGLDLNRLPPETPLSDLRGGGL